MTQPAIRALIAKLNTLAVSAFEKMAEHNGDQRKADLYEAIGHTITECAAELEAALAEPDAAPPQAEPPATGEQ